MTLAALSIALLLVSLPGGATPAAAADSGPRVRIAVIGSAGQGELTSVIKQFGIDQKHGIEVEVIDYAAPGQQYTLIRSSGADVVVGNFVDLLRQRNSGAGLRAFYGFQGYSMRVVTKTDSPIKSFADLKGKKVGEFGTTFLDWLILRAAGKKAYGVDIGHDAEPVQGAPPLLNQFLAKGDVDATLQFPPLTFRPLAVGEQRLVTDVPHVMKDAGFDPDDLYLQWMVADQWVKTNPGALDKLAAVFDEAYVTLKTDDSVWPALSQKIGITDAKDIASYRAFAVAVDDPPYNARLLAPTQSLVGAIVDMVGAASVGITKIDPTAFVFPTH